MISDIIRFTSIYVCTILLSRKILNIKAHFRYSKTTLIIGSLFLSLCTVLMKYTFSLLIYFLPLFILWIITSAIFSKPQETFISTTIAFAISHTLYAILSFVSAIPVFILFRSYSPADFILTILASISLLFLTNNILQLKRIKNGLPFLFVNHVINIASFSCMLFITALTLHFIEITDKKSMLLALLTNIILPTFLIHWWQAQITKSYRHSLEQRELESLRIELQEKDKQLAELSAKNTQMGHIIHEDTKILRTFVSGIEDYLAADLADTDVHKTKVTALLQTIHETTDERLNAIRHTSYTEHKTHNTAITELNLQLNHFEKRAVLDKVTFHVHIACLLEQHIPHSISKTDLTHLLSNLLDNAFIAASYTCNPVIQIQFYEVNKQFVIEIADSGIPFEAESSAKFGLVQRTTHANDGGSGIGLMEIWKIKENYRTTLHIEEYETPAPFTKKISLTFNNKNKFTIRTYRKDEIQYASKRIDLQIYE